jgi:hypothetical protein
MSERAKQITVTFLGECRRMVDWTPDVTPDDMIAAARMIASQVADIIEDDEE